MELDFNTAPIVPGQLYRLTAKDVSQDTIAGKALFGIPEKPIGSAKEGEIFDFKIENPCRGPNGAAKKTMRQVEAELCRLGFESAFLRVDKNNAHAIDFYERMDWQRVEADQNATKFSYRKSLSVKEYA